MAVKFLGYIITECYCRKGIITRWKYAIDVKKEHIFCKTILQKNIAR